MHPVFLRETLLLFCRRFMFSVQIRAVFTACAVLILGGWVDAKRAVGHVNWGLLVLIGCALGFSKAMANSGLAHFAGRAVRESGMSESASLYALFGLTMVRRTRIGCRFLFCCCTFWQLSPVRRPRVKCVGWRSSLALTLVVTFLYFGLEMV